MLKSVETINKGPAPTPGQATLPEGLRSRPCLLCGAPLTSTPDPDGPDPGARDCPHCGKRHPAPPTTPDPS